MGRDGGDPLPVECAKCGSEVLKLYNREPEYRSHRIADSPAQIGAAGGLADQNCLNAEGRTIADEHAKVLRVRQSVHGSKEVRLCRVSEHFVERDQFRYSCDSHDSLVKRKSHDGLDEVLGCDEKFRLRRALVEIAAECSEPFLCEEDGEDLKIAFEKTSDNFFSFGNKDPLLLMVQRPPKSAVG